MGLWLCREELELLGAAKERGAVSGNGGHHHLHPRVAAAMIDGDDFAGPKVPSFLGPELHRIALLESLRLVHAENGELSAGAGPAWVVARHGRGLALRHQVEDGSDRNHECGGDEAREGHRHGRGLQPVDREGVDEPQHDCDATEEDRHLQDLLEHGSSSGLFWN